MTPAVKYVSDLEAEVPEELGFAGPEAATTTGAWTDAPENPALVRMVDREEAFVAMLLVRADEEVPEAVTE